jgi:Ni,Fe-hydrogenase III small subunit
LDKIVNDHLKLVFMHAFLSKVITTPKNTIARATITETDLEVIKIGGQLNKKIKKLFGRSLSIRQVDAGSDNACENELTALTNGFYDVERFGIRFVASPRHADMLMVTGPVARNMAVALKHAYNATPDPKIVVAVGDDAIDGGVFKGSYATYDGVSAVIPVDYAIPGDPPTPLALLRGLLAILSGYDTKKAGK